MDRLGEMLAELLEHHRGKLIGSLLGLVIALAIMRFGFWWTLFIALAVGVGYAIGRRVDEQSVNLMDLLDRILPPVDRR